MEVAGVNRPQEFVVLIKQLTFSEMKSNCMAILDQAIIIIPFTMHILKALGFSVNPPVKHSYLNCTFQCRLSFLSSSVARC